MFMYSLDFSFLFFMFLTGLFTFVSLRKHLLVTLLSLEYLVLCVYLYIIYFVVFYSGEVYVILMFLTFSVCEGVLGLSILVGLIRCHGNDQVNSLFLLKW
uniref:NADH-ubiquinone oxidoreductase chain 4L n=2 Tax=Tuxedo TaxID=237245 RepID=A0A514LQD7_9HEMI|nr:NADH dehydrogenase subunit 4L [Tuxedo flavicollis]QDI93981.1 NADH dehydrogenase subunit 4L [Tuxedo flavicollis]QDI94020.1 NADH dehydrogenase subunit 4L [Tuxedo flavicollis]QDI94033.1 NADH dehydrogenase subunit 4L [Tuxedo flavicollis]QDI94072.1 NADH dehydrogenase subunit 4L [Tuxedo susansolomonae]